MNKFVDCFLKLTDAILAQYPYVFLPVFQQAPQCIAGETTYGLVIRLNGMSFFVIDVQAVIADNTPKKPCAVNQPAFANKINRLSVG